MPALTDLDIVNRAIVKAQGAEIGSLDQNVPLAALAKRQYRAKADEMLSRHRWVFAKTVAQLSKLATPPAGGPRAYAYARPADLVGNIFDYRLDARDDAIKADVLQMGDYLWSDSDGVWVEYTARVPEAVWPPWFQQLVVCAFAIDVANARKRRNLAVDLTVEAFGSPEENGQGGLLLAAEMADSQDAPPRQMQWRNGGALVEARFGGGLVGDGFSDQRLAAAILRGL